MLEIKMGDWLVDVTLAEIGSGKIRIASQGCMSRGLLRRSEFNVMHPATDNEIDFMIA
jgi:hypothetical protein